MTRLPEVLVIGGGPAACATALRCRALGLRVIMIASAAPGRYAASESIHPGLQSLLIGLGVTAGPDVYALGSYQGIAGNGGYQPLNPGEGEPWEGHHINKEKFSKQLQNAAAAKGVEIIADNCSNLLVANGRVTGAVGVSGRVYNGRFVIDCSGRQQVARRSLKLRRKYYSPPLVCWSGRSTGGPPNTTFWTHEDHWNWIAPETDGCCGWTRLAKKGWTDFSAPDALREFSLKGPVKVWNMRWHLCRPLVAEGLLICGDAAGMVDPAASQGIFAAILSGIMAANAVRQCLDRPSSEYLILARYDQWFVEQYEIKAVRLKAFYLELLPGWFDLKWIEL